MEIPPSSELQSGAATLVTSRVLRSSPSQIYDAFARPELLARWWGPDGFSNTFEVFEFTQGGRWKFVMHGPDGTNYPNENVFERLEPSSAVVIRHISQPHFVLTVTLEERESGTALRWVQAFESAEVAARIRHICEPANEQNLDRLTAVLASNRS